MLAYKSPLRHTERISYKPLLRANFPGGNVLNCRESVDPTEVLESYPDAVVLIRDRAWTIPHTEGGLLRGVNFDTQLGIAVLSYDSASGSRRKNVDLAEVKEASWNQAETEFTFTNGDGITIMLVPLD